MLSSFIRESVRRGELTYHLDIINFTPTTANILPECGTCGCAVCEKPEKISFHWNIDIKKPGGLRATHRIEGGPGS